MLLNSKLAYSIVTKDSIAIMNGRTVCDTDRKRDGKEGQKQISLEINQRFIESPAEATYGINMLATQLQATSYTPDHCVSKPPNMIEKRYKDGLQNRAKQHHLKQLQRCRKQATYEQMNETHQVAAFFNLSSQAKANR